MKSLAKIDMRQVQILAERGEDDKFMAMFFGVSSAEWMEWKAKRPKFYDDLKTWREIPTAKVEAALFMLAVGFEQTETVYEATGDIIFLRNLSTGDLVMESQYRKRVKKVTLAPNIAAVKYWLNNQDPDKWRDRLEVTDENKVKMGASILEARARNKKFAHQRKVDELAAPVNGAAESN